MEKSRCWESSGDFSTTYVHMEESFQCDSGSFKASEAFHISSHFSCSYMVTNLPLNPAFLKGTMLFPHKLKKKKKIKKDNPTKFRESFSRVNFLVCLLSSQHLICVHLNQTIVILYLEQCLLPDFL